MSKLIPPALSFLIAGLGQLVNGQAKKGVLFFLMEVASSHIFISVNDAVGLILNLLVTAAAVGDAYMNAGKNEPEKRAEPVGKKRPELNVY